jgi:hypothetical protein
MADKNLSDVLIGGHPVTITLPAEGVDDVIINEPEASVLTVAGLQYLRAELIFSAMNAPKCRSIIFPDLIQVGKYYTSGVSVDVPGHLSIRDHHNLRSISAPNLTTATLGRYSLSFQRLPKLTTLDLPLLSSIRAEHAHAGGSIVVYRTGLASLSLSIANIDAAARKNGIVITQNPNLQDVQLSSLSGDGLNKRLIICGNPSLTNISSALFGSLDGSFVLFDFRANAITTANLNAILNSMPHGGEATACQMHMEGGTNGAPTGSALTFADSVGFSHN